MASQEEQTKAQDNQQDKNQKQEWAEMSDGEEEEEQ